MKRRSHARARDANESEIFDALARVGYVRRFDEPCDILFCRPGHWPAWFEVKDGRKPPHARPLTPSQVIFFRDYPGPRWVARSVVEALCCAGVKDCDHTGRTMPVPAVKRCGCGGVDDPQWFIDQRAAEVAARKATKKEARKKA